MQTKKKKNRREICFRKALGIEEEELKKRNRKVGEGGRDPGEYYISLERALERSE